MAEYFLSQVNLDKISEIEELCKKYELVGLFQEHVGGALALEYEQNRWEPKDGFAPLIQLHTEDNPIFLRTTFQREDYQNDPLFNFVKDSIAFFEAKKIRDNFNYLDMNMYK